MAAGGGKSMDPTDKELLARYRAGEADAMEILVTRYQSVLFGFILNMTEGREDADEIFQEVWLRVIRKLDSYRHGNFPGWLVRIARNIIIDRSRRRKPVVSLDVGPVDGRPLVETIPGKHADPAGRLDNHRLGRRITAAVDALPAEQKEVFLMRVRAELPFKEIARIQKVSINTALARMQYALSKLRPLLAKDYDRLRGMDAGAQAGAAGGKKK